MEFVASDCFHMRVGCTKKPAGWSKMLQEDSRKKVMMDMLEQRFKLTVHAVNNPIRILGRS